MLQAQNLRCVRGERQLFSDLGFTLDAGELLYLQGKNGAGKTSLLRMLVGLLPPAGGEILWKGRPIGRQAEEYRAELCYLGHHNGTKEDLTPLENLLTSARLAGEALSEDDAVDALEQVGLAGREDIACKYLSQGQKRRVALARLVKKRCALWILDEPFVALDTAAVGWLTELIGGHLQRGGLCVMTTHQPVAISAGAVREQWIGARPAPGGAGMAQC
ncbi:heme ABC exporter ATP-binding protein CcmA [Denitratisoma sp. DHT3]|uniref:cytochrome c biogenesis heme-transporting ATPase CcmA n=1 Tax=Denitratisoma sp. DHT3 TaxID=1981880 RepID=UPI0011983A17|nr:cytochrome c biogenesis heme-transporting ATPase CcmA [Denitratisoma sp. DHT3]QDX81779.1 heme ABC exporter ATP-binding protein CcmA [Denitratisoma sp. DHT3]